MEAGRRTTLVKHLSILEGETRRLWAVGSAILADPDVPDRDVLFGYIADAIGRIAELEEDFWDLDPTLAKPGERWDLELDFSYALTVIERGNAEAHRTGLESLLSKAPPALAAALQHAASPEERRSIVDGWKAERESPELDPRKLDRELGAPRRWRRIHAAWALARHGAPDLIDPSTGDVDPEAIARWRAESTLP
jgi:hypothetical protein